VRFDARPARGDVPVRLIVFGLVGIALLVVPLWWMKRERPTKAARTDAAERAATPAPAALPQPAAAPDPDRLGLTFGWSAPAAPPSLVASCRGLPGTQLDGPEHGDCKPTLGDTSCRRVLPVLCLREGAPGARPALATVGEVAGYTLATEARANAICAGELGAGWRMARFEDAQSGFIDGERPVGVAADTLRRAWVATRASRANCWDGPP
jgi:hypothetical protein